MRWVEPISMKVAISWSEHLSALSLKRESKRYTLPPDDSTEKILE